jgi:transcriptional regulator with XRE-family HTH domain
MTFGDKLQALRKQHKMSQETLAEKLNISRMAVSRWETGQSLPDIQQNMKISETFKVSVDYLKYERIEDLLACVFLTCFHQKG